MAPHPSTVPRQELGRLQAEAPGVGVGGMSELRTWSCPELLCDPEPGRGFVWSSRSCL